MQLFLKRYRHHRYRLLRSCLAALLLCQLVVFSAIAQPTPIRRIDPVVLAEQVYQQLPELPKENQYLSSETGEQAITNTLISRLIRYHVYIKNRATVFRLDWKLTLADYLGAFERISPDSYPDYGLQDSPYQSDIAAIDSLSAEQRTVLVNTLYETFTTTGNGESTPEDSPSDTTSQLTDNPTTESLQ